MNFIKNILLLLVVLVLSYFCASWFGSWYDKFSPQHGSAFWGLDKQFAVWFAGIPVAYVFFVTLLFKLFGFGNKKKWMIWLLVPAILLWISSDKYHIYLPILLGVVAYVLAWVLQKIFVKFKIN